MDKLEKFDSSLFDSIKHIDEDGNEYWSARELQKIFGYTEWRTFNEVIEKAKINCISNDHAIFDNFVDTHKIVRTGVASKKINNYKLSRYACYLIALNGDPRKKVISLAKDYFATKTRTLELLEEEYKGLSEDRKRIYQRNLTRKGNLALNQAAKNAGVRNFKKFTNFGYKGLYNGETAADIFKRKNLRYREDILDNMGSEELGANIFRITQTEAKLKKDKINSEDSANETHYYVGKAVREAIAKSGNTMPEDLPTPEKSVKELEKNIKKIESKEK